MLVNFIQKISNENKYERLIAGVDPQNNKSVNLLKRIGFVKLQDTQSNEEFYEYMLY